MRTAPRTAVYLVVAMLVVATSGAWAQDRRGGPGGRNGDGAFPPGMQPRGQDRGPMPPPRRDDGMSDSVRSVERSHRGQVLNAERIQSDGRDVNRIKVLDDRGRIRVFMDDPQRRRGDAPTRDDDN